MKFVPGKMTHDQVREVSALIHVENELIDEALGRVMARIEERGWGADTDVVFTTDHGELQGDFGLLFKGPVSRRRPDASPARVAPGPECRGGARRGRTSPSATSTSLRLSARSPGRRSRTGRRADPLPDRVRARIVHWVITEWDSQFPHIGMKSALDLPATAGSAPPTSRARCTRAPRASSTTWTRTRCSGATSGTTPPTGPGATSSSPISTTTFPPSASPSSPSKRPSRRAAARSLTSGGGADTVSL